MALSVKINDVRGKEFSNRSIVVRLVPIQRMKRQEGCRRSKNENALHRRLLSELSGRSTLVVRWIAPASGSGRYYERSREKKSGWLRKTRREGTSPRSRQAFQNKEPRCCFTGGQYVNQRLAVVTMSRPRRPASDYVLKPSPPPPN